VGIAQIETGSGIVSDDRFLEVGIFMMQSS
jgi:hypothetical protein